MFDKIGRFSSRYRYPIIVGWLLLLALVVLFAPSISDVVVSDQSGYLPDDEPSIVAAQVAAKHFPDQAPPSQAVIVLESETSALLREANRSYLAELTGWLENDLDPEMIGQVLSPTDPNLAQRLISESGQVGMIFVGLRGSIEDPPTLETLNAIKSRLNDAPTEITGYVTGSVAIVDEYKSSALESADRTTLITIILVILILLAIYRSPVSPVVPLATIGVAFVVSRGLVAWLTNFGMTVSSITEVFLVVLLFGAGTDYCLFLVSRFREYMADELPGPAGARRTVARVGETITSSAGTVIVGMVALSFAEMGLFASSGPALALGVAVALLAGLTLTPALLAVLGQWAFWPGGARRTADGAFWGRLAGWVTTRPWIPLLLTLIVLVPLAIYGQGQERSFDLLGDLPDDNPSKAGFKLLSEYFGAGEMQPLDVIVTDVSNAREPAGLTTIHRLTQKLLTTQGIADVRSLTLPAGQENAELGEALRVDMQLAEVATMIDQLGAQATDPSAMANVDLEKAAAGLSTLRTYLQELAEAFPNLAQNPNYQIAQTSLDNLERTLWDTQQQLLVSQQLAEAADGLMDALNAENPTNTITTETLDETRDQFAHLRTYLTGMAQAHPILSQLDGYDGALTALDTLDAGLKEVRQALQVSTQLDLLAEGIGGMAASLQDPDALSQLAVSPDQTAALALMDAYLQELVAAYPSLADQPAYSSALENLAAVETISAELAETLLVSRQLGLIAQEMDAMAQALEEDPLSLMPKPDEPSAAEQMSVLGSYLEELGAAYPSLAATEDYQTAVGVVDDMSASLETIDLTQVQQLIVDVKNWLAILSPALQGLSATAVETLPQATLIPENLPGSSATLLPDLSLLIDHLEGAADDFSTLAEGVRREMPKATFVPETPLPGASAVDPMPELMTGLDELAASLNRLSVAAAKELPDATYLPPEDLMAGEMEAAVQPVMADVEALQSALDALADDFRQRDDGFFIPLSLAEMALVESNAAEQAAGLEQLLETYSTADGEVARLQVILTDDPFDPAAMDTVARMRDKIGSDGSRYISGSTAVNLDLREVMDRDFVRVMILVIGGISIVLVLLLRSLVAPVYMLATILLSYGATLGITRLVFDGIYHQGLTWWVPFLMFVVLVALGMDYNIFLMGRVKEEVAEKGTRTGIERAVQRTGGIITSAGIIMAGTFGAMMSSSLVGLVQLAFAVAVGMLLDTFVIRTTLVPAIAVLLDRWNWWPGKGPQR